MNFLSFFLGHSQRWKSRETFNLASSHLKLFHIRETQMRKRTANRSISFVTQRCPSLSAFQRFLLYADWNGWLNEAKISSGFRVDRARAAFTRWVYFCRGTANVTARRYYLVVRARAKEGEIVKNSDLLPTCRSFKKEVPPRSWLGQWLHRDRIRGKLRLFWSVGLPTSSPTSDSIVNKK